MVKRKLESSARDEAARRKGRRISKRKIDFSDIPEITEKQLSAMRRVGRPLFGMAPRQIIAIRIDPEVLKNLRRIATSKGKGYQTLINEILAKYIAKKAA